MISMRLVLLTTLMCVRPLVALDLDPSIVGSYSTSGAAVDVAVSGNYAYLAAGTAGLQVIDLTNPATPRAVGGCPVAGEGAHALAVSGNYACVAAETALVVINISTPTDPRPTGSYPAVGSAVDVAMSGNYAYLIEFPRYTGSNYVGGGLQIINISNPANPQRVGGFVTTGNAVAVALAGSYACVVDQPRWDGTKYVGGGLEVIDISNPANPQRVGRYAMSGLIRDVAISGRYAYVTASPVWEGTNYVGGGLHVIDMLDPANPQRVGGWGSSTDALAVAVAGRYAYITDRGLNVIDINNPANPQRVGGYEGGDFVQCVATSGNYAYLGDGTALRVVDIADPADPHLAGGYAAQSDTRDVAVAGGYAYLADGAAGLQVIDLTISSAPTQVGGYFTGVPANGIALSGTVACVAASDMASSFLYLFDVSLPTTPQLAGSLPIDGEARAVAVAGNHAYVACNEAGLQIIDISDPAYPQHAGTYENDGAVDIAVSGNRVYLVDWRWGLHVIDVSNPSNPQRVGGYASPRGGCTGICLDWEEFWPQSVSVAGAFAYLGEAVMMCGHGCRPFGGEFKVLNISNPTAPQLLGTYFYHTFQQAQGITVSGNVAYIASARLHAIDITSPAKPDRVGACNAHAARNVAISGARAYVASGSAGLEIIELGRPANPQRIAGLGTEGHIADVAVSGGYACLAAQPVWDGSAFRGPSGLEIIDISDITNPRLVGGYHSNDITASGVAISGNYAALSGPSLEIIDISNAANPQRKGSYRTNDVGWSSRVALLGNHIYVGWNGLFQVISITNPASPRVIGSCALTSAPSRVILSGNYAYVAGLTTWQAYLGGLEVIDIADPARPRLVGGYLTNRSAHGIALSGSLVYLGDDAGLHVLDLSNPANPRRLGAYLTTGPVADVAVWGKYAYLANQIGQGSLEVIDITNPAEPQRVGGNSSFLPLAITVANDKLFVAAGAQGLVILHTYQPIRFEHVAADASPRTVRLQITGPPRVSGRVQRSADLLNWSDWLPVNFSESPADVLDPDVSTASARFYRLVVP